jgi:hypothetical protein
LLEGSGWAQSSSHGIEIHDASPGRIVLKYHWLKSLRASPGVEILPFKTEGDSWPLILLNNRGALTDISIWNEP